MYNLGIGVLQCQSLMRPDGSVVRRGTAHAHRECIQLRRQGSTHRGVHPRFYLRRVIIREELFMRACK